MHHNKVARDLVFIFDLFDLDLRIFSSLDGPGVFPSNMGGVHDQAPIGAAIAKSKSLNSWPFSIVNLG